MKTIIVLFLLLLLNLSNENNCNAQVWVSFGNSKEPKAPEITLITSTNTQVVFSIEFFGFYKKDTIYNDTEYQMIYMPGVVNYNIPGYPDLPLINKPVAYSGKIRPTLVANISEQTSLSNYMIFPAPELHDSITPEGFPYLAQVFYINNHIYEMNAPYPTSQCSIASAAQFRDQKFINVVTNPLQWNPTTKLLTANIFCTITVNLNTLEPPTENVGIFSKAASELFINYKNIDTETTKLPLQNEKHSYIQYYTLNSPDDAANIDADYLIITDQQFFQPNNPNSELRRIAQHRANYNGYVVAILSAQNIMSDAVGFNYSRYPDWGEDENIKYKCERRIHECIKMIYDNGNAPHTQDGHLAYVLLVGDAEENYTGTIPSIGLPASRDPYDIWVQGQVGEPSIRTPLEYPTDYFYSLMTQRSLANGSLLSVYDDIADLYIGRFAVDDDLELKNIIDKTINYEMDYDFSGWKKKSFFFNSEGLENMNNTYFTPDYGYYNYFIPNRVDIPYTYDFANTYAIYNNLEISVIMPFLNRGQSFVSYFGHAKINQLDVGESDGQMLTLTYLKDNLSNNDKVGFIDIHGCDAGLYDYINNYDCLAEELTTYSSDKGYVGVFAASCPIFMSGGTIPLNSPSQPHEFVIDENYMKLDHLIGGFTTISKIKKQNINPIITWEVIFEKNLFGDPALNLQSQGFSVTHNTILDETSTISDEVHVLSGVTLTLPDNCNVNFGKNGRLIIDQDAYIKLDKNATFHGIELTNAVEIHGGIITTPGTLPNITFDAPENMSCSGLIFENSSLDVSLNKLNLTRCALFANHLKSLTIVSPIDDRSIINESPIQIQSENFNIRYCDFVEGSYISAFRQNIDGTNATIRNCTFSPPVSQPTNQQDMIYISGYANFDIADNNPIEFNSGNGINIFKSGSELTRNIKNNNIEFSGTIYYQNNGIKLYQSNANIENNTIVNAKYGISLFNNSGKSVKLLGNYQASVPSQTQQIVNNTLYQLFSTDAGSFPINIEYNYFNNLTSNPLIYCSGSNIPAGSLNVKCNNWGSSFVPSQDLYPFAAYTYEPIWNFDGVCMLKSSSNSSDCTRYKEDILSFKSSLLQDENICTEKAIYLSNLTHEIIRKGEISDDLMLLLDELNDYKENNVLKETAKTLRNILYIKDGKYDIAIRDAEQRLSNPNSLADSIYAAIDLAQTVLIANEGLTKGGNYSSKFQQQLPNDYNTFYIYENDLTNLLYPISLDDSTPKNHQFYGLNLTISPNPAKNFLLINFNEPINIPLSISIFEPTGKVAINEVVSKVNAETPIHINTSTLPSGSYFLNIKAGNTILGTKSIIIMK